MVCHLLSVSCRSDSKSTTGVRGQVTEQYAGSVFDTLPKITQREIIDIKPVIRKWLDFYKIDLSEMRLTDETRFCPDCAPDTQSIHYREFLPRYDADTLIAADYSPDKQRYVDLGIPFWHDNGKYYNDGWDDSQEIYLIDRKLKHANMILWFGSSQFADAVFWKNNSMFIVVGRINYDRQKCFVYVFDMDGKTERHYESIVNCDFNDSYMDKANLKEKGIISK
jgi:hypothetical protein